MVDSEGGKKSRRKGGIEVMMAGSRETPSAVKDGLSFWVWIISIGLVIFHIAVNVWGPYGFHRDEFLYLAMGEHLRLFGMDFPPFIALIANFTRMILGSSLAAIRFFPAAAAAVLVLLSADISRRLGGGTFAQILTALLVFFSPIFLRPGSLFQPVIFDQLWWTLGCWVIVRWKESGNLRWWIALGIVMGIGLFTKFSIFVFWFRSARRIACHA